MNDRQTDQEGCLVPRRLSFDENVRAKEGGKETTGETRFALASAMRKTKRLRKRLPTRIKFVYSTVVFKQFFLAVLEFLVP